MATGRSSRVLFVVLVLWAVFGSWLLFRPSADDVSGLEPEVGHVVVFFFVSLATFGLSTHRFGVPGGLAIGVAAVGVAGAISEWLQPILTDTRMAQRADLLANGVGIGAALLTSLVLIGVLRSDRQRAWIVAAICVAGLGASVMATFVGLERPRAAWECRNAGYRPLDAVLGQPIIHVEADTVLIGASRSGRAAREEAIGDGVIATDSADLRCSVLRGQSYTIVATVVPESLESNGPTRIFTSSAGVEFTEQNTHLGQQFDQLSVRVKTDVGFVVETVPGVFEAGEPVTVAVAVADGEADVFVDGERVAEVELGASTFFDWDPSFPVLIGDEFTRSRTFEGRIETVSVFDRRLDAADPALTPAG